MGFRSFEAFLRASIFFDGGIVREWKGYRGSGCAAQGGRFVLGPPGMFMDYY
jgi:hypothetical protein